MKYWKNYLKRTLSQLEMETHKKMDVQLHKYYYTCKLRSSRKAALCTIVHDRFCLKFNGYLMAQLNKAELKDLVIHEFAHMVAFTMYGFRIDHHGPEWRGVMKILGAKDLSVSTYCYEKYKKLPNDRLAKCKCPKYYVNARTAKNIIEEKYDYTCTFCKQKIRIID